MKQKKRVPLLLESLEDRWVPATVRYLGGTLIVSNPSVTAGTSTLKLTFDNTNHVAVTDNGNGDGSYTVGGEIIVLGSNAKETITVDLNGQTYTGDLFVSTGNGNDVLNITSSGEGGTGVIAGNVTILAGNGADAINLNATGSSSMTIGGNFNLTTLYGKDTFTMGNGTTPTSVLGNVTLTDPSTVNIGVGSPDVIGGNLSISGTLVSTGVNITLGTPDTGILVQGNFTETGGLGNDTLTVNSSVFQGSVNVSQGTAAGVGADVVSFGATKSTINGNLIVQTGAASTTFDTGATTANWLVVQGNVYLNLGDNNNSVLPTGDINVLGTLQLTEGNGNDTVNLGQPTGVSRVGGNLIVNLGNGTDQVNVNGSTGGMVEGRLGNGNDTVVLGDGLASDSVNYNGFVVFGNGADSLALGTNGLVSGTYIGGTNPNNAFSQSFGSASATLSPFFQLINFP